MVRVWPDIAKVTITQWPAGQEVPLLISLGVVPDCLVVDPTAVGILFLNAKIHCNTNTNKVMEDISAFLTTAFAAGTSITFEIDNPNLVEFVRYYFAKAIDVLFSMKEELLTNAMTPFSATLSLAQRKNRAYMS